jgi:hypothetical protein
MKRIRIDIRTETRRPRAFTYKPRKPKLDRQIPPRAPIKPETMVPADSYLIAVMKNLRFAKHIKAPKTERLLWGRLMRFLATGERDDGKRPRIRIVDGGG